MQVDIVIATAFRPPTTINTAVFTQLEHDSIARHSDRDWLERHPGRYEVLAMLDCYHEDLAGEPATGSTDGMHP